MMARSSMLHVRGLIHCCSSHVRRSWSFCLATHGPGHTFWHKTDLFLNQRGVRSSVNNGLNDRAAHHAPLENRTAPPHAVRWSQQTRRAVSSVATLPLCRRSVVMVGSLLRHPQEACPVQRTNSFRTVSFSRSPLAVLGCSHSLSANAGHNLSLTSLRPDAPRRKA